MHLWRLQSVNGSKRLLLKEKCYSIIYFLSMYNCVADWPLCDTSSYSPTNEPSLVCALNFYGVVKYSAYHITNQKKLLSIANGSPEYTL